LLGFDIDRHPSRPLDRDVCRINEIGMRLSIPRLPSIARRGKMGKWLAMSPALPHALRRLGYGKPVGQAAVMVDVVHQGKPQFPTGR
jgi:hypothetical protein